MIPQPTLDSNIEVLRVESEDVTANTSTVVRRTPYNYGTNRSYSDEYFEAEPFQNDIIVIRCPSGKSGEEITEKIFYWKTTNPGKAPLILMLEGAFESIGELGKTVALSSNWPEFWEYPEGDDNFERGISTPTYKQNILFSKTVEIHTSSLPRWIPQVIIDRRALSSENEQ